jgi:GAF domain
MDGQLLSETFVELTDTMVADFDVIDFLHVLTDRSVQLLDVSVAGLLLADPRGELRVVAASSEAARLLELFQLQNDQGPCLDCFRSGRPVVAGDLAAEAARWPRFAPAARRAGFAAVQALPMRLRQQVIEQPPPSRRRPRRSEAVMYRVRVDLDGTRPPLWRRLELASDLFLDQVHEGRFAYRHLQSAQESG